MAVIGAVLGDIAGSRFEFHRPGRLDYKKCELFVPVCTYTDDTVMTLAVKKAIEEKQRKRIDICSLCFHSFCMCYLGDWSEKSAPSASSNSFSTNSCFT